LIFSGAQIGKLAFLKLRIGAMAFDATLPVNNSQVSSAELRGQFTSLKTLVDGCPTTLAMEGFVTSYVLSAAAASIAGMTDLSTLAISNPPTQAQLQTVVDKLNELIGGLQTH
jgi:hypothetical protein